MKPRPNLPLDIINEDWIRYVSWDFYVDDEKGRRKLVTTLEDLKKWLGIYDDMPLEVQARKIEWFMTEVPSYHGMPKKLKREFIRWAKSVLKQVLSDKNRGD